MSSARSLKAYMPTAGTAVTPRCSVPISSSDSACGCGVMTSNLTADLNPLKILSQMRAEQNISTKASRTGVSLKSYTKKDATTTIESRPKMNQLTPAERSLS